MVEDKKKVPFSIDDNDDDEDYDDGEEVLDLEVNDSEEGAFGGDYEDEDADLDTHKDFHGVMMAKRKRRRNIKLAVISLILTVGIAITVLKGAFNPILDSFVGRGDDTDANSSPSTTSSATSGSDFDQVTEEEEVENSEAEVVSEEHGKHGGHDKEGNGKGGHGPGGPGKHNAHGGPPSFEALKESGSSYRDKAFWKRFGDIETATLDDDEWYNENKHMWENHEKMSPSDRIDFLDHYSNHAHFPDEPEGTTGHTHKNKGGSHHGGKKDENFWKRFGDIEAATLDDDEWYEEHKHWWENSEHLEPMEKADLIDHYRNHATFQPPPTEEKKDTEEEDTIDFQAISTDRYTVLDTMYHDERSFTQGLSYSDGILYESAGLYGQSKIRKLNVTTGKTLLNVNMDKKYFAEGLTYYGDGLLIQITWKSKNGFIYNATDLSVVKQFEFSTKRDEGWGITYNEAEDEFIVSDGSDTLHFWDGVTLEEKRRVVVTHPDNPDKKVRNLNELEFYKGFVLSNVWQKDLIYRINYDTGAVEEVYDFGPLWPHAKRSIANDVLNGISVTENEDELFVTGKKWPTIYRIKLEI